MWQKMNEFEHYCSYIVCTNRLGVYTKRETHGLGVEKITLLHVWATEDSTRDSLLVEALVLVHIVTFGYWIRSQVEWRR